MRVGVARAALFISGGVAGIGGAFVVSQRNAPHPNAPQPNLEGRTEDSFVRDDADSEQDQKGEARGNAMNQLPIRRATFGGSLSSADSSSTAARHSAALISHKSEPIDRGWSGKSEQSIRDALAAFPPLPFKFKVDSADCKMTTCLVHFTFDAATAARQDTRQLVAVSVPDVNCDREVWVPTPDSAEAFLLFDCTELRASSVR